MISLANYGGNCCKVTKIWGGRMQDEQLNLAILYWYFMAYSSYLEMDIASKEDYFDDMKEKLIYHLSVQHPNFTRDSAENDLMLIKLKEPLKLNDQVKLAILPNTTDDRKGDTCTVSGWGWPWQVICKLPKAHPWGPLNLLFEDHHHITIVTGLETTRSLKNYTSYLNCNFINVKTEVQLISP